MGRSDPQSLQLPPPGLLPRTSPVDKVDWYYQPVVGWILRKRLAWILRHLPERDMSRVLEVGYGSGIFLPQLARRSAHTVGVDVHPNGATVRKRLATIGARPHLVRADGGALPFRPASFDAVVAVSTLEFVPGAEECVRECLRVVRPGGSFLCSSTRRLHWADTLCHLLTGVDPEREFRGGRQRAERALARVIPNAWRSRVPESLSRWFAPYDVWVFRRPDRRSGRRLDRRSGLDRRRMARELAGDQYRRASRARRA